MAKDKITTADYEALDATAKAFYKPGPKGADGAETYVLDSEEGKALAAKLHAKDETIRQQAEKLKALEEQTAELAKRWEGIEPDVARDAMEAKRKIEAKEYLDKGDVQGLIARHEEGWKERHKKEIEAAQAERDKYQSHLHRLLVKDRFHRLVTAGEYGEGESKKLLPVIDPRMLEAAEALFETKHRPKIEVVKNGDAEEFRAVALADGLEVEMGDFMVNHFIPRHRDAFFLEPQHQGGKRDGITPARANGSPAGQPRTILASDQAAINAAQDDIAKGDAIVVDG